MIDLHGKNITLTVTKSFAAKIRKLYQMQAMSLETLKSIYLPSGQNRRKSSL